MSVAARPLFAFDDSFVRELDGMYLRREWAPLDLPAPSLLVLNETLAEELGVDVERLRSPEGLEVLTGARTVEGSAPVAQAYSGHQFGGFSPRLGDGRALLLGEVVDVRGERRDLHLKGSGRTPFSRGGDGKAAVGPMLREHLIGEAMHFLGIPTTRSLAVVATGERVLRESGPLPGAVLARVAASHLRVGTFQYAAVHVGPDRVRRVADYAIARHHPACRDAENPYLALYETVVELQAQLIARWMNVGFIHGVMNTDNMTISGETIDYGPCAFMDAFDPATVFSSIDVGGRYAFGMQPRIGQWNLARLAEPLLPLLGSSEVERNVEVAMGVLGTFPDRYERHWRDGMRAKLGLSSPPSDVALYDDLLLLMQAQKVDFTSCFRALAQWARGSQADARSLFFQDVAPFEAWAARWTAFGPDPDAMDRVNPVYVPRNHLVEEALEAASARGDMGPFFSLLEVLSQPFDERDGLERYTEPASVEFGGTFQTFCGT